jgi:hypothetical protein
LSFYLVILPSISAQLFVCPKSAKLPSYLAFYLLLIISFKHQRCLTEGEEASNCAEIDACFFMSPFLSLANAFLSVLAYLDKQAQDNQRLC